MAGPLDALDQWPVDHVAAAVVDPGGVVEGFGLLERRFALASVTKPLTSLAILVAVEEGSLALDEPAGPPGSTVEHLLAHASGLGPADTRQVLAAPGTRRIYSNAGFEVLADHLAKRTGIAFGDYLAESVLDPLGLGATTLDGTAAAGATSTVADLTRFLGELLEPSLVTVGTLARATAVAFPGLSGVLPGFGRQDPNDWGLGFELRDGKRPHWTGERNDPATFGHFGQTGTFLWVDPVARRGLVVLTDRSFGPWAADRMPELSDRALG